MPPIVIIWNNLHGGVVSGLGMIFIYMVSAILTKKPWRKYFGVLAVSTPLLVINPYGSEYLNFLFSANTKNRSYITEWWGVFVQRHVMYYYPIFCTTIFTVILTFISALNKKKFDLTKILALLVTTYLGVTHVKLLSLVLIVIASLFYNEIVRLFNKNSIRFLNKIAFVTMMAVVLYIPFTQPTVARTLTTKYPVLEVEFLKQNNIQGNLLTAFGLGSYTSYKLYPQNLIYMDGRYEEVYYDREFENLINYEKASEGWQDFLKEYGTEILMPEKTTPIYSELKKSSAWEEVFTGDVCGVFLYKNRSKNKGPFIMPSYDLNYYKANEFKNLGKFGE